jgi:hypothetical protein
MQQTETEAREAGEQRDAHQNERVTAQKELEAIVRNLELKRSQASSSPEPVAPTEEDVKLDVTDPRPTYAAASAGGIVALFIILMLVTGGGNGEGVAVQESIAADEEPTEFLPSTSPAANRIPPTPMPQPNGNGNGAIVAQPTAPASDSQPGDAQSRIAV